MNLFATISLLAMVELQWVELGPYVALLLLLVVFSGAFSGSETVLFSLTRTQLEHAAASTNPFRRQAALLMRSPKRTLMTVLVANTAVNVLLFSVSYVVFTRLSAQVGAWVQPVSAVLSILLVVVVGEVVPKVLAVSLAERLAPLAATLVRAVSVIAGPLGRGIDWFLAEPVVRVVLGTAGARSSDDAELSRTELKTLLEMSRREGMINPVEDTFLRAIVDLEHLRVGDVMVHRTEMIAFDVNGTPEGLRDLMRTTRFRKIPVYDSAPDEIVGLIYARDLYFRSDVPMRELVKPVHFVPEVGNCAQLLHHFQQTKSQLAIAVDEFGGVAGLVTLEDVLEEIVGEIGDADEAPAEPEIRMLPDGRFDVSGGLGVQFWIEALGRPEIAERVVTVGGLVMAQLGRPAQVGDLVRVGNVEMEVTRVERRRVVRLALSVLTRADVEGAAR